MESIIIDPDLVVENDFKCEMSQTQLCNLINDYSNTVINLKDGSLRSIKRIRNKTLNKSIRADIHNHLNKYFLEDMRKTKNNFILDDRAYPTIKTISDEYIKLINKNIEYARKHYNEEYIQKTVSTALVPYKKNLHYRTKVYELFGYF